MRLTFDADLARAYLELSRKSADRRPNFSQLLDPDLWRDDMDPELRRLALADLERDGYTQRVDSTLVDPLKVPVGLWLVGDQGVFLRSNAPIEEVDAAGHKRVAYADEVNPETMEFDDWYAAKRRSFGGDDGVDFLSEENLEVLKLGAKTLEIDISEDSFAILLPPDSPTP